MDGLLEIKQDDWSHGGTPDDSRIIPWGVQSISSEDINHWQGRLESHLVDAATESLIEYLRS